MRPERASSSSSSHGLRRVLLVRADDPRRTALDPAGAVQARHRLPFVVKHATALVAHRPARIVERHARERHAAVADAAEDEPTWNRLALFRRDGDEAAVAFLEPVAHDLHALDALLALDRDRRREETQAKSLRLARRFVRGEAVQDFHVSPHARIGVGLRSARRVELQVGGVDDDVRARELGELRQLGRREGRFGRAAAPEHDDLLDPGARDRVDRSVCRVRRSELLRRQHQHPRDVECHVAVPDHDRALHVEVEREVLVVGMAVVPGHELES